MKPYFTKMTIHPLITVHVTTISRVLWRTWFDRSRVFHISKRSVLYQE